jgi:hypothetical protein
VTGVVEVMECSGCTVHRGAGARRCAWRVVLTVHLLTALAFAQNAYGDGHVDNTWGLVDAVATVGTLLHYEIPVGVFKVPISDYKVFPFFKLLF